MNTKAYSEPYTMRNRPVVDWLGWGSVAIGCAIFLLRPLLTHAGLPAFNQDWAYPPTRTQANSMAYAMAQPYLASNFGFLNFYISSAAFWVIGAALSAIFGVSIGLRVFLFVLILAAFFLMRLTARALGATGFLSGLVAILYACSPVVANELAAGHVAYLLGYACLPGVLYSALLVARTERPLAGVLGILFLAPLSIAQPQFAVFNLIVCLSALPFCTNSRRRWLVVACATYLLAASPYGIALALFAHAAQALSFDRTNLHWEGANSAPLGQAFLAAGYPAGYDRIALNQLIVARSFGGLLLWGAMVIATIRNWRFATFSILALLSVFIVSGVNGPLAPILSILFTHIPAMALFRELYSCSCLVILGICACISGLQWKPVRAYLAIPVSIFVAAQVTSGFWGPVAFYNPNGIRHVVKIIQQSKTDGYVAFLPLLQPMGPKKNVGSGADPMAFPIAGHPSLSEFVPAQPLSQLDYLLRTRPRHVNELLASFGIKFVVLRPAWASRYFEQLEPALRSLVVQHPPPHQDERWIEQHLHIVSRVDGILLARVPRVRGLVRGNVSGDRVPIYRVANLTPPYQSVKAADPRLGWVDASRWQWWNPTFLGPVNPAVFAINVPWHEAPKSAAKIMLNAPEGGTWSGPGLSIPVGPTDGYQALVPPSMGATFTPKGAAVILGTRAMKKSRVGRQNDGGCSHVRKVGSRYLIRAAGCASGAVEVLARPESGWVLLDSRGRRRAPDPTAWDTRWFFSNQDETFVLRRHLPWPLFVGMICQYGVWAAGAVGGLMILGLSVRNMRRLS